MDENLEKELESEFGDFGIDIEGNLAVLEKLCELCKTYKLESADIVARWMSFAVNKNAGQDISVTALEEFESKKLLISKTPSAKKSLYQSNVYNISTINKLEPKQYDDDDDNVIESYVTTPKSKPSSTKRLRNAPDGYLPNKKIASFISTPVNFSPSSLSPGISTPSAKFESRVGKAEVLCTYGASENMEWKGVGKDVTINNYPEYNVCSNYKHMFQKIQIKADILNDIIITLSNQMKQNLMIDDFDSLEIKTEDVLHVTGRVCCDSVGRLNSKSIVLEGSREFSTGKRMPIDLSEAKNYSLFPGQIVAMRGKNISGSKFLPSTIYTGCRLPFYSAINKVDTINENSFTIYVACGPFSTCDETTLSYNPLEDLLSVVLKEAPDILLMLGPFVDVKQPLIERGDIDQTFEELFQYCYHQVLATVKNIRTKVLFVPSQRDAFHTFVYPQPPFEVVTDGEKIQMMSDPCTLMINDVCFGITSTDILFHLGGEEVSSYAVRSDRLGRLVDHLLQQQCYYPLHPSSEDVNLDYEKFESYAFMPVTPDILVLPSDLRYFIKDLEGCLCINPGRLVKGQTGGTFLKLLVKPRKPQNLNKSSAVTDSVAQIVRI
ncbi:DNA polymerase alpha subunit B isoform X2 [Hydra vulgaris]|uniref:DNA polymerase alpha subunit B n=1 Tax=Hydra vulgaris TaxID=6087 RepID=A0ABM4CJL5_HYDVU